MQDAKCFTADIIYKEGKLSFTTHNNGVSFDEALAAITAVRDECQRQIDNKDKCPFSKKEK